MKQISKIISEKIKFKSVALTTRPKCLQKDVSLFAYVMFYIWAFKSQL